MFGKPGQRLVLAWQPCLDRQRWPKNERWRMNEPQKKGNITPSSPISMSAPNEWGSSISLARMKKKKTSSDHAEWFWWMTQQKMQPQRERERERLTTMPLLYSPLERSFSRSDNINPCLLFLSSLVERSKHSLCVYSPCRDCALLLSNSQLCWNQNSCCHTVVHSGWDYIFPCTWKGASTNAIKLCIVRELRSVCI